MLLLFKKYNFSKTVHCMSPMPRLSQTLHFLQSPSFWRAQSALIGQLTQCFVIGRTPQARVGNLMPLSIILAFKIKLKTVNDVLSFLISSSQNGNRVAWQTQWWSSYVFAHKPRLCDCLPLSHTRFCDPLPLTHTMLRPSLSLSISYTQRQNSAFEQSIANT